MSPNFHYFACSPRCQTQPIPLDFVDPPSTSRNVDGCQILLKKYKEKLLSVQVAELTTFQRSKVLDVYDDTYQIISHYRHFSLERHETSRHLSELGSQSIQIKLYCFFFLDIFFMRDHNLLSWTRKCRPWRNNVLSCFFYQQKMPCTHNDGKEEEENFIWIDSDLSLIECPICYMLFKAETLIVQ
jgi:hypothetical protein